MYRLFMLICSLLAIYYNCVHPNDRDEDFIDTKKYPASLGIALEICAGIIDKDKPVNEIAREEVLEECGYNVELKDLHKIMSYRYSLIFLVWRL